jgi:histidinol-phosphate phosphatase family protein
LFSGIFNHIFIVTNQRGVGKGLMPLAALELIHQNMSAAVAENGGRIDGVYFCTAVNNDDPDRKPNPGMAYRAKEQFPSIAFHKSIMVGNTSSDMEFGRKIGAYTVYIHTREDKIPADYLVDARYQDLYSFAQALSTR